MKSNQFPRQYSKWRKWREIIQIWGLVIPGFAGILISLASFFLSPLDLVLNFLLLLFSILALAIGLERYDAIGEERKEEQRRHKEIMKFIESLDKEIAEVHRTLASHTSYKVLDGFKEVYNEATRLIRRCKGREIIRTTSVGDILHASSNPPNANSSLEVAYSGYLEALAKRIGEAKQQKLSMQYHVIMGFQPNAKGEPPLNKQQGISRRRELFKDNNASDRLHMKYLPVSWSLDVLIVGDEHILIGFPTITGDREIRLGIRISDMVFVKRAVQWYNEHLWNVATPLTWTEEEIK